MLRRTLGTLLLIVFAAAAQPAAADNERREYFVSHYTKYEYRIPMRDGVRLFTAVYVPKDASQTWPILLQRTPYTVSPYGADNYRYGDIEKFIKEGFIFAYQDVRGRIESEGEFVNVRPIVPKRGPKDVDESTDAYDTVDWLVKNVPNNNGRVGIWGISYPGFYAAMAAIDAHPALKAASPQAPIADWFLGDDWRHNGALMLAHAVNFFASFGRPWVRQGEWAKTVEYNRGTVDGYDFFLRFGPPGKVDPQVFGTQAAYWKEILDHDRYDDYWKARRIGPHLKNVKPAMLTVGGWFDAEDVVGPMTVYQSAERQSPGATNTLVIGPWSHGGWMGPGDKLGNVRFASKTGDFFRDEIMLPFFVKHLKDKGDPKIPEAWVFETGRNVWRRLSAWPPANAAPRTLYLGSGGKLAEQPPREDAYDEYISDPARPVPFTDEITPGMTYNYMTSDQRFASRRTDVLVYQTEPLTEDLTVAGPVGVTLYASTSGTDSDFVVKLIDVYPGNYPDPDPNPTNVRMGGYHQLVRGEPFRGRFRNSFEKPEPFQPNQPARIAFSMPDIFHTFRRGHRVMVHVQSSWFPLVDLNPQKYVEKMYAAAESDYQKATQRVYRAPSRPSAITLHTISESALR